MTFYMIRDTLSGLFYKRGTNYDQTWVKQDRASVWTERSGASACLGTIRRRCQHGHRPRETEIITITVKETE